MKDTFAFVTRGASWRPYGLLLRQISERVYGVRIPGNPLIEGPLRYSLASSHPQSLVMGENLQLLGGVDLRTRDHARLVIGNRVKFDGPVRIVAAGRGEVSIGDDTRITCYTIINGGGAIRIGRGVIIGPRSSINANEHRFRNRTSIVDSGFDHVDISIGDDVWLGSDVSVLPGADIATGTVIGANSVVNSPTEPYSIYVGSPARKVGQRPE